MNGIVRTQILQWTQHIQKPLIIGINGPQGSGKSTLVKDLKDSIPLSVVTISLDDFYIPYEEQLKMTNPLLQYRGLPGTHSISLICEVLSSLRRQTNLPIHIPVFDKSLHGGRGDRLPPHNWTIVNEPVDVVLFEGWSLGFQTLEPFLCSPEKYEFPCSASMLSEINENLKRYQPIHTFFDCFVQIKPTDISFVKDWRWEQEITLKKQKGDGAGLSYNQVQDFVSRFMPIYDLYLSNLNSAIVKKKRFLAITIDQDRRVLDVSTE